MSELVEVEPVEEFGEGERRFVEVEGREVAVLNHEGEYYAFLNTCPHVGGPVGKGDILREETLTEEGPGRQPTEVFADNVVLTCPWHSWEYDLETGTHAGTDRYSLTTYDVVIDDGTVCVKP